jgi:hypothetical protein
MLHLAPGLQHISVAAAATGDTSKEARQVLTLQED